MGILDRALEQKQKTEEKLARGGGGGFSSVRWWRPKAGENKVRVMPPWDKEKEQYKDQFWREVAQHWNVSEDQKGPVLCPKRTPDLEGDCPICEFVEALKSDKANVESQKLSKELRAKTAYFLNVVDLNDPTYTAQDVAEFKTSVPDKECPFEVGQDKIQVYACPVSIFDQILGLITSSKQDITKLEDGRNLTVKKIAHKDRFKTRYEVYPELDKSSYDLGDEAKFPALDQLGFNMEYDKMVDLLQSGAGGNYVSALPSNTSSSSSSSTEEKEESSVDLEQEMLSHLGQG